MEEGKGKKKGKAQNVEVINEEPSDEEEFYLSDEEGARVDGIYIPPPQKPTLSFDPTGPRLIITKIENNFFKSYAEHQVLGPFHKCFNAIVGPNGSGKSNVIDSLLFVFGYRATKIRCKKVSVLLHNSENYRNVQTCTVAIYFALIIDKEGDNYDIVPGSEFVISRTANKDNSSYYELNRKRAQFKDIAVILKKHGVDLDHNRFLILQGEVEQIAMMKCKGEKEGESGMLEYLEGIIGTSRYKKPLEQVHERVEILAELRTEKLNRLKIVENELEELRGPMEEAVGFLKAENTIVRSKNFLYQKSIKDMKSKVEIEKHSHDEVLEVQKTFIEKLKALEDQKKEHMETQNKEAKIYENLKKKKETIKEAFDKANKKDIQLQADMMNKIETRKKTKEQIAEEKKKLIKLESVPEESEKNIEEYEAKRVKTIATNEKHEAEKEVLLKNIQSETQGLQAEKEEILKELAVLKEGVNRTKSAFNLAETELKVCISNEENEKGKLADLQKLASTSKVTIEERTQQVVELKRKIPATEKILNETNVELLQVKQEEANLINTIRSKRASLEEVKSSMQASRSSGRVLDSLMQAKRDGKCPGLFGRLGDLGDIDSKYDVAVSTACGPLDNIVVDTVDCAQWCIEFLKKHAIGRGVFIALEKQEHLRQSANSTIQTPENVRRLYDLIKVKDERVKTAFYYALRDTLVADDLDQATRIAYGARRYRVVTLKGDLIETTGTMSGGGKRMLRGRMGQSLAVANVDPRELQRMEGELETLESRVRELRQTQSTLEVQISELQPQLRQMKIDYEKYNQELQSLRQQQPDLARQVKEQEVRSKATKADAGQVQKLTAIVAQRKQEYDAAAEKAGFLQVKVDQLTKEIKDKSTGKIRAVDKQIKECTKIIEQCKTEIVRMKVAVKTAERNYNTTKENIARMEQDVEEMENSLRAMKQDREEIKEDAKKFLTSIEEITEQLGEREKVFLGAQKTVDKITKQENQLKSDKIDVDEKLKGHQKKLKEYNATVHAWEAKLSHLKLQEITNETIEDLKQYTDDELEQRNAESTEKELQAAENLLKVAKPNLNAIQEYSKIQTVYMERTKELEEITAKRTEMRKIYDNLRSRRKEEFLTGYNIIKLKLKEMYQMITLGGDAEFELVDTYDPFAEGIQFNVRPPRKTWKKISNLSGGEKTLSSLALVFALHYYKPSPLYVMDEIDAALDFKNVSIVGNYIKERTKNAQFIIISLHSNMFELCDNLVGIYKTYNTTKTITINPRIYDKPPAQPVVQSAFDLNRRPDRETRENRDTNQPNAVSVNQDKQQGSGDTGQTLFDDEGGPAISSSEIDKLKTENMELSLKIKELRVQLSAVLLDKTGLHEKLLILQNANEALSKKLLELREQYNVTFTRISIGVENNDVQSIKDNLGRLKEIQDHFNVLQKDQIKTENEIRDHEETFTIIVHTAKNAGETPREIQEKEESHTTRQMFLNSELEEISKKLLLKEQLAKQLVTNTRYMVDEQALMDTQKKIENLEKEKEELLQQLRNVKTQENSNKLAEQRRKRMQELEQQLKDLKKVSEQSRLIKLREKDEQKIKQLNQEITSMKSAKVKLLKQMREETDRYRNWRQQTEKELARVKQQDRKKETEIAKMKVMHEKQKNLLKRKFEEAAALNKRLQSTLMKRKQAEETRFTGKVEKISSWLEEELDIYVYLVEADTTLAGLLEDRATLKHQLDELKNNPEMAASSEIKTIEVDIELRSVQIQDLQPKLLDSDEENKAKTRFDAIQTMAEAKYALRTLFDQAAEFRKKEVSTKREMSEIRDSHKELLDKIDQLTKDMKSMEDNYSEQLANHERASQEKVGILLMQMRGIKNEDVSPESELLRRCQIQDERIAHQESIIEEQEKTISGLKKRLEDIEKTSRAAITPVPQKVMKEKVANNQVTDSTFVEEHEVRSADETDDVFDDIENDPDWRKTPLAKRIIAERKNNKLLRVDQMNNNTKDSMTGTKRSPTGGCTCRTNCSTVRCGCRKLGRGCSTFCKCNETACRNRHDDEVSSMECGRDSANPTTSDIATDDSDNTFKKPRVEGEMALAITKRPRRRQLFTF